MKRVSKTLSARKNALRVNFLNNTFIVESNYLPNHNVGLTGELWVREKLEKIHIKILVMESKA